MIVQLEEDVRKNKLSPKEEEDERGKIKERVDKEHAENHKKWLEFLRDWEKVYWSLTEVMYEKRLEKFIADWNEVYPTVV